MAQKIYRPERANDDARVEGRSSGSLRRTIVHARLKPRRSAKAFALLRNGDAPYPAAGARAFSASARGLGNRATADAPKLASDSEQAKAGTLREFKDNAERAFLVGKLRENGWNISKTAEVIDTPRSNLYKKLEQYAIKQETDG